MKKKTGLTIAIVSIFFILSGITYAWWTWNASSAQNTNVVVTIGGITINYEAGPDITSHNMIPVASKTKGINKDITVSASSIAYLNLYLDISMLPKGLQDASFKYELVKGNTIVKSDNFSTYKDGDSILLLKDQEINSTSQTYQLSIWIDGTMENPSDMYNQEFKFILRADGTNQVPVTPSQETLDKLGLNANEGQPDFSQIATTNEGIYSAPDDYGTSYYFRGAVDNNYVNFAGFYWRIIRINGDGSIRMIYDGTKPYRNGVSNTDRQIARDGFNAQSVNDNAGVGYMYGTVGSNTYEETHANTNNSTMKTIIDNWYQTNIEDKGYGSKVVDTIYCNDRSLYLEDSAYPGPGNAKTKTYYGAYNRLVLQNAPNLICPQKNDAFTVKDIIKGNGALIYPVGMITTDEVQMAGMTFSSTGNTNFYLYSGSPYRTMSPYYFSGTYAYVYLVNGPGSFSSNVVRNPAGARPVISLKPEVTITGTGTINDPYTVQ